MNSCWAANPTDRPNFRQLTQQIELLNAVPTQITSVRSNESVVLRDLAIITNFIHAQMTFLAASF